MHCATPVLRAGAGLLNDLRARRDPGLRSLVLHGAAAHVHGARNRVHLNLLLLAA